MIAGCFALAIALAAGCAGDGGTCCEETGGSGAAASEFPAVTARLESVESGLGALEAKVKRLAAVLATVTAERQDGALALAPIVSTPVEIGDSPYLGPEDARVTIIEFADFECPFCASAVETMERLLAEYPGALRWVFKHSPMPIHRGALAAHKAAQAAAAQDKFWEMHHALFAAQDGFDAARLRDRARALGLDLARFDDALESNETLDAIRRDREQARALGVVGVPSFFVNGRFVAGAQPYEFFRQIIDAELAGAR